MINGYPTPSVDAPPAHFITVTPSDSVDLAFKIRAINVAEDGFVRITSSKGSEGVFFVAAGGQFIIDAAKIWASGTTATGIVGMA